MKQRPPVAVVSVTYNRCGPLLKLLAQLREADYPTDLLDVFLVDNASNDDTVERVRAAFPEIHLTQSPVNTGISAGFNLCTQEALRAKRPYKYLWLLDSDAEVEPQTLLHLVEAMERDEKIGVVGSAVYDPEDRDRLVTPGLRIDWKGSRMPAYVPYAETSDILRDVDLIPACSLLTRSEICTRLGLWDLRFPLYCGDTDWCARVLRNGYRVCCHGKSRVWHRDWSRVRRGFGAPPVLRDLLRGSLLFNLRHAPSNSLKEARHLLLVNFAKAACEHLTMRHGFRIAYLAAVDDLLAGSFSADSLSSAGKVPLHDLDTLVSSLVPRLGTEASVLLNQIEAPAIRSQVREAFDRHFRRVRWKEIPYRQRKDASWSESRCIRPGQLPELLGRSLTFPLAHDVNVCDVSNPLLYNLAAGKYTLLLDSSGRGVVDQNRLVSGLAGVLTTLFRGLKATYVDLPRAVRQCTALREAINDVEGRHSPRIRSLP